MPHLEVLTHTRGATKCKQRPPSVRARERSHQVLVLGETAWVST